MATIACDPPINELSLPPSIIPVQLVDDDIIPQLPPIQPLEGEQEPPLNNVLDIISSLPPPPTLIDDLDYGHVTDTEPQLEVLTLDGEIPRFDEVNEQYEFLRRTLSHSRRRYSSRFKKPRPKTGRSSEAAENSEESSLDMPGRQREDQSSLDVPNKSRSPNLLHPLHQAQQDHSPSHAPHPISRQLHAAQSARRPHTHRVNRPAHKSERRTPNQSKHKRVDSLGRTYYMDHSTHTMNYEDSTNQSEPRPPSAVDFDARREMLNRRYQSLQRSFRTAHHRRRDPTQEDFPTNLTPIESFGAISYMPSQSIDDNSTSSSTGTTSSNAVNKKSRGKSGKSWFSSFGRKNRTVSQTNTSETADNIIPISTELVNIDDIYRPISPPPLLDDLAISFEGHTAGHSALIAAVDQSNENGTVLSATNNGSPRTRENGAVNVQTLSASDLDVNRSAAAAAAQKKRASRRVSRESNHQEHGDTDDETNDSHSRNSIEPDEVSSTSEEPSTPDVQALGDGWKSSPALLFITRRDLYTFLNSAGEAGRDFLSQRALMELVQRIRADNNIFIKYQHSRQLVQSLNKFVLEDQELPDGWEKKLNKQGKVFFIDHNHQITSFIDPRLPQYDNDKPHKPLAHVLSVPTLARRVYSTSEEREVRPHHSTVVHSLSSPSSPPPPSNDIAESLSASNRISYEEQVVAFFNQPNIERRISQRYQRGVRPQMREAIEDIKRNGVSALERVQLSGGATALELTLILSIFEDEISAMTPSPRPPVVEPDNNSTTTGRPNKDGTIQKQKQAFAARLQTFKLQLARLGFAQGSRLKFNIRRDHLLEDSYEHVMKSEIRHLQRKRLNIAFQGEDGLDYGGPSREFFYLISRNIFNPYFGLFEYSANDTYTIQISPTSSFIQNNMDWFRFAGRIVGLVIAQGFLLDVFFTRPFYKTLLGKRPVLRDLESLEPAIYSSLLWIQDNDPEPLDLTFTVEEEAFGQLTMHELKEGGADTPVLEENKLEYIDLMVQWRLDRGVTEQMQAFMKGCAEIMPRSLLQQFDSQEIEFIIAGTLEIDVDDWKANTEYRNGYHADHPVVLWFWQAVEMFDNEQRLKLLQFVTGTSSVPFEGFAALRGSSGPKKFTIDFFNEIRSLPRSHTCFNRLDLPPYPTFEILFEKLRTAIEEGGTFGIE